MRCGNKSVKDVLDKSGFPDIKMGLSIDQPLLFFFFEEILDDNLPHL